MKAIELINKLLEITKQYPDIEVTVLDCTYKTVEFLSLLNKNTDKKHQFLYNNLKDDKKYVNIY